MNISRKIRKKIIGVCFCLICVIGVSIGIYTKTNTNAANVPWGTFSQETLFSFCFDSRIPDDKSYNVKIVTCDKSDNFMDYSYVEIKDIYQNHITTQYFNGQNEDDPSKSTNVVYNPNGWTLIMQYDNVQVWLYKKERVEVWKNVNNTWQWHGTTQLYS